MHRFRRSLIKKQKQKTPQSSLTLCIGGRWGESSVCVWGGVGNRNVWISGRYGELEHRGACKFLRKHVWMVYLKRYI